MWCAFTGPPNILRVHGSGEAVFRDDPRWAELIAAFRTSTGPSARAIIVVHAPSGSATPAVSPCPSWSTSEDRTLHAEHFGARRTRVRRVLREEGPRRHEPGRAAGAAAAPPRPVPTDPGAAVGHTAQSGRRTGRAAHTVVTMRPRLALGSVLLALPPVRRGRPRPRAPLPERMADTGGGTPADHRRGPGPRLHHGHGDLVGPPRRRALGGGRARRPPASERRGWSRARAGSRAPPPHLTGLYDLPYAFGIKAAPAGTGYRTAG